MAYLSGGQCAVGCDSGAHEAVEDGVAGVGGGGGALDDGDLAGVDVHDNQVGEGSAGVNADADAGGRG